MPPVFETQAHSAPRCETAQDMLAVMRRRIGEARDGVVLPVSPYDGVRGMPRSLPVLRAHREMLADVAYCEGEAAGGYSTAMVERNPVQLAERQV